jgi:hypothetical protein
MPQSLRRSHVYVVRTWIEVLGDNQVELRGMVRNVQSGETRYFRTWDALVAFVNDANVNDPSVNDPNAQLERRESPADDTQQISGADHDSLEKDD